MTERDHEVELALEFGSPALRVYVVDLITRAEAAEAKAFALEQEVEKRRQREKQLVDALCGLEWAGTVWTDEPCCLFCGALASRDLPAVNGFPAAKAGFHDSGCEWAALVGDKEHT